MNDIIFNIIKLEDGSGRTDVFLKLKGINTLNYHKICQGASVFHRKIDLENTIREVIYEKTK